MSAFTETPPATPYNGLCEMCGKPADGWTAATDASDAIWRCVKCAADTAGTWHTWVQPVDHKEFALVQSARFPNVWSLVAGEDDVRIWRDPMFQSGAMAAENAVLWARENGHTIVAVQCSQDGLDCGREVVQGIEYRSRQAVVEGTTPWDGEDQ